MELIDLFNNISVLDMKGNRRGDVTFLSHDSRTVTPGSLFIAIEGLKQDGHVHVPEALARGARYVVHDRDLPYREGVTYIRVADSRSALGPLARNFYGDPSGRLSLIGVTGTNGKTTVCRLLESILSEAGHSVGVLGTINYRYAGTVLPASHTTPEPLELQRILRDMADSGITHVVMEVSSHALALRRVDQCRFDVGVFTNFSQDHLDYHGTMSDYFQAKRRFFTELLKDSSIVLNADDPSVSSLIGEISKRVITFGIEGAADAAVDNYRLTLDGIEATAHLKEQSFIIASRLLGRHNLSNILAAIAAASVFEVPHHAAAAGIAAVKGVRGRLERVDNNRSLSLFVDYAHTEDALRKVLAILGEFRDGRIITVFGCGGDRDRLKRPLMGRTATELSDMTIVTSDNPRMENPLSIISEIEEGIDKTAVKKVLPVDIGPTETGIYTVIPDRRSAITAAIRAATPRDIILIAGKGHEDCQIVGTLRFPFDDRAVAEAAMAGALEQAAS